MKQTQKLTTKAAFTLAETLIALAVIGIVAAMTIPALVQKHQEKVYITKLKKLYSVFSNAYQMVLFENGGRAGLNEVGYTWSASDSVYQKFKPYLNVVKECDKCETGCITDAGKYISREYTINLVNADGCLRRFVVLNDGTSVGFFRGDLIYVDVNGLKKPNRVGEDIFQFRMGNDFLTTETDPGEDDATGTLVCYTDEWTCSAWALKHENLDYLHCDDLNWKGKHKCSDK